MNCVSMAIFAVTLFVRVWIEIKITPLGNLTLIVSLSL